MRKLRKLRTLERLLNRIWSGELNHYQAAYFSMTACGTAGCVAGWDYGLDIYKGHLDEAYHDYKKEDGSKLKAGSPWDYSQEKYGLTNAEATLFFASGSTVNLQKATLKALKSGRRLEVHLNTYGIHSMSYEAPVWLKVDNLKEFTEFFGDSGVNIELRGY